MTKHSNVFQRKSCFTHIFSEITVKKPLKNLNEVSKVDSNSKKISKQVQEHSSNEKGIKYKLNFTTGRTNDNHYERIVRNFIIKLADGSEIHVKDFITELPLNIDDKQKVDIMGLENFKKFKETEAKVKKMEIEKEVKKTEIILQSFQFKNQEENLNLVKNIRVQEEPCR